MQSVVNSLAVLSFLGVILLLFANSALLRIVRDLQQAVTQMRAATPTASDQAHLRVEPFARNDDRPTFALVVDSACPACRERSVHLAELASDPSRVLLAVSADEACAAWFAGTGVQARIDSDLLGHVGVNVTPTLIKYDHTGREQWRRVVASDADLDRLLAAEPAAAST
jgi:hypothetical protein